MYEIGDVPTFRRNVPTNFYSFSLLGGGTAAEKIV